MKKALFLIIPSIICILLGIYILSCYGVENNLFIDKSQLATMEVSNSINNITPITAPSINEPEIELINDISCVLYSDAKQKGMSVSLSDMVLREYYSDIILLAKVVWSEARGVESVTEQACVIWTILNRVDNPYFPNTIRAVILQRAQFCVRDDALFVDDYGRNLFELAFDVVCRWVKERAGDKSVGRVLPKNYIYFYSYITTDSKGRMQDGNAFYSKWDKGPVESSIWKYRLNSPYEN